MAETLRIAYKKQSNHEPIGQSDLHGSFTALVKRGFIDSITIPVEGKKEVVWYVTKEGLEALDKIGLNETILIMTSSNFGCSSATLLADTLLRIRCYGKTKIFGGRRHRYS